MTGRPAKSLLEHVEDGSFRARKHEELLERDPLLPSTRLAALQRRYRRAKKPETRRRIALEFERVARGLEEELDEQAGARVSAFDDADLPQLLDELGPKGSTERIVGFFPRFLKHRKGERAGRPFELDPFQKEFSTEFHARDRWGRRLYTIGYLIVPGGNGKSPLAAGYGLEALCELEDAPRIYVLAGAKEQADELQDYAREFVEGDEDDPGVLKRWLRIRGKRIVNKRTRGVMTILPASGALLEGKNPSVVIIDELHAFETTKQEHSFTALVGKLHKRKGWALVISTAGRGAKNILRLKIKEILARGPIERPTPYLTIVRDRKHRTLLWLYAAPKEAPLEGPEGLEVIKGCNPASWLDPRDIVWQLVGVGENEFRRLARNEFVTQKEQWLPVDAWDARADTKRPPPDDDEEVVLAFDGSYNNDSTALVGCTPDKHIFVVDVWERPEDEEHWLVPRGEVKAAVDAAMRRWNVRQLFADPPGWYDEVEEWGRIYGDVVTVMFWTNQIKLMSEACREFYGDVVNPGAKGLTHDGDPRLARHLANAFKRETPDGAYIVKETRDSQHKIDAAVAAVLARYGAVRVQPKKSRRVVSW